MTSYFSARPSIDGDDDDSYSGSSAEPRLSSDATVVVNSLSTWRQDRYHGDGRVPTGGELQDNNVFRSGDRGGYQNYDDTAIYDDEKVYNGGQQYYDGDGFHDGRINDGGDRTNYDGDGHWHDGGNHHDGGDGELHGGDEHFHDDNGYFHCGANQSYSDGDQNFYKDEAEFYSYDEHDGKHFADNY